MVQARHAGHKKQLGLGDFKLGYGATRTPETLAHEISSAHWVGYPVDPWLIATREGLRVHHSRALPAKVLGVLARESSDAPIMLVLDGWESWERLRFTLAHMLGHYARLKEEGMLEQRFGFIEDAQDLSIRTKDPVEKDAARFAHKLLMPEEAIHIWHRGGTSIDVIRAVLDVPKNILRERFRELNLPLREEEKQY